MELKVNSTFNDKIVECIPVPIQRPQFKTRSTRDIETAAR
jgi:hypothetical protein